MPRAFVAGAGGAVGEAVVHHLLSQGWNVIASMRRPRPGVSARLAAAGARVIMQDLDREAGWSVDAGVCDAWIFTTHLERTLRAMAHAGRLPPRIVAFSSNNVAVHPEAVTYRALAAAERALRERAPHAAIVRPTLVYGDARLPTVTRLLRLARWSPVLPLPGSGRARVQPVFADDLGRLAAGLAEISANGVFAAGGPEVLSMHAFFTAIAAAAGAMPAIVPMPNFVLRSAAWFPFLGFSKAQAERAERDRVAVQQALLPAQLAPQMGLRRGLLAHLATMQAVSGRSPAHA